MFSWQTYPPDYRQAEVQAILTAVQAGECAAVIGLSGAGKSNLLGFLAHREMALPASGGAIPRLVLIDCNRMPAPSPSAFWALVWRALDPAQEPPGETRLPQVEAALAAQMEGPGLCLLLDRFEVITEASKPDIKRAIENNLRAMRDLFKYSLTLVIATRRPLDPHSELAELFYAHTLWLGPLSAADAHWNVNRYARRRQMTWDAETGRQLIELSGGYPALLKAVCEAYADGAPLSLEEMAEHPAVRRRVSEFWASHPEPLALERSRLGDNQLLLRGRAPGQVDTSQLTQKEHLLWSYFCAHPKAVCAKDDLIHAVWPEDQVYVQGIRDDSLAQLVRRLREKVEADPSNPQYIQTVPGRGYRFIPG